MIRTLLLAVLPLLAKEEDELFKRMDEISGTQAPRICNELRDVAAGLDELRPLYEDRRRFESARARREDLLTRSGAAMDEFTPLRKDFLRLGQAVQAKLAMRGLRLDAADQQLEARKELVKFYVYHEAYERAKKCIESSVRKIDADSPAFLAASKRHSRRSARNEVLGIAGAAVLLFLGVPIFLARRMAARTVHQTLVAEPKPAGEAGPLLANNIRLDRLIGQGGMGLVYEGTDLALDRKVAVKQMRDEISENPRGLSQFLAEARMVASLKHPNIVEIYSILKEQGRLYLVFEYVEGSTLDSALALNKRLTLDQSLSVLRQAASALDYAHSRKVIHRDLKPSNIMLTPAGVARLMDFGIAYQAKKTIAMMTRAERWGTPAFMAPEQELGSLCNESDIYALGVCFYAMLTGTLPFPGPDHLAQKRDVSLAGAERLPAKLLPVMKKVFSVDPRQRFHTGAELVDAVAASS